MPRSIPAIIVAVISVAVLIIKEAEGLRCYQCSTNTDPEGSDFCGAYEDFERRDHISVECASEESNSPGDSCLKIVHHGPRAFFWSGRSRHVIRRCGSATSTGVRNQCSWGVYENGVYWEECSCTEDACNTANGFGFEATLTLSFISVLALYFT